MREVPPRKVATFYLDSAEAHADDVSERMLETAMRRTLDGLHRIIELESEKRPPTRRPGVSCRWCPISDSCDEGAAYLAGRLAGELSGPAAGSIAWSRWRSIATAGCSWPATAVSSGRRSCAASNVTASRTS